MNHRNCTLLAQAQGPSKCLVGKHPRPYVIVTCANCLSQTRTTSVVTSNLSGQKRHIRSLYSEHERDHYITLREIGRIRKIVERENIQLDPNDAISAWVWTQNLQAEGDLAFYKNKQDLPPEGSNLAHDLFLLCNTDKIPIKLFLEIRQRVPGN